MKRYFDLSDLKLTAELEIKKGSDAETASTEQIKKTMGWNGKVEEVCKARYNLLKEQYNK